MQRRTAIESDWVGRDRTLPPLQAQASTGKPTAKHCGGFQQAWEKKRQKPSVPCGSDGSS